MSSSETALQYHQKSTSLKNRIPSWKGCFGSRPRHMTETFCPDCKDILLPVLLESRQVSTSCLLQLRWNKRVQCPADSTIGWHRCSLQEFLWKSGISSGQLFIHSASWALYFFASLLANRKTLSPQMRQTTPDLWGEAHFSRILCEVEHLEYFFFLCKEPSLFCSPVGWSCIKLHPANV